MPLNHVSSEPFRILLVDDEPSIRRSASRLLAAHGFDVAIADSAEQALDYLGALQPAALPSAILTDIIMPGMNGYQLGGEIARRWPHLPVAYMSGLSSESLLRKGILLDAAESFVLKPLSAESLLVVARLCGAT